MPGPDPHLHRLYQHLAWADRQALDALRRAPAAPAPALRLLAHLLSAERIWLGRIRREPGPPPPVWPDTLSLDRCEALLAENHAGFQAVLDSAGAADLAAPVTYRTSKGEPFSTALRDILLHVALHGAHHRGQIALLLRLEGLAPAGTDLILFVRQEDAQG